MSRRAAGVGRTDHAAQVVRLSGQLDARVEVDRHRTRPYYVVLVGVSIWLYVRHRRLYPHVRRTFVAMCGLALMVFWVLPVSPPRFALPSVLDIVAEHEVVAGQPSRDLASGANHFSAFPSLHVGWSAWCAYAVWSALRRTHPRVALLAWIFPLVMSVDVLATGNHYVLDIAGSAALLVAGIAISRGWDRLRALGVGDQGSRGGNERFRR